MRGHAYTVVAILAVLLAVLLVVVGIMQYHQGYKQGHDKSCRIAERNGVYLDSCR